MIKRTIKETVREYDVDGKVVRETVTETTEDDDTMYFPPFLSKVSSEFIICSINFLDTEIHPFFRC